MRRPAAIYIAIVFAAATVWMARWPIAAVDSDLWYHLAAGRWIVGHHRLPASSEWFSFLDPPRAYVDYYWLFQLVAYATQAVGGPVGLIALRTAIWLGTGVVVLHYLLAGRRSAAQVAGGAAAWTAAFLLLSFRATDLRPHLYSYLCLALVLWVLEHRPRAAWATGAIAIAWVNLHGVEYPVMLAVAGAYLIERFLPKLRGNAAATDARAILAAALPFAAPMLTPNGLALVSVPFVPLHFAYRYMSELATVSPGELALLKVEHGVVHGYTWLTLLVLGSAFCLARQAARRALRPAALLVFLAGLALVGHGVRFVPELALLCLPAIRDGLPESLPAPPRRAAIAIALAAAVFPVLFLANRLGERPAWPVARVPTAPIGAARFLERTGLHGRLLDEASAAGYYEWAAPDFRTFMDLQIPFVFRDEDIFVDELAYRSPEVLRGVLSRYAPDFIAVPRTFVWFPQVIGRFPRFVPVFFDDAEVIYLDGAAHPELAAGALAALDPFAAADLDPYAAAPDRRDAIARDLARILEADPDGGLANVLASRLAESGGDHAAAAEAAARAIAALPLDPSAREAAGDAALSLSLPADALRDYRRAIGLGAPDARAIHRKAWKCDELLGRHRDAYRDLQASLGAFPVQAGYGELYELGVTAIQAGEIEDARMWLDLAMLELPPGETEYRAKIEHALGNQ